VKRKEKPADLISAIEAARVAIEDFYSNYKKWLEYNDKSSPRPKPIEGVPPVRIGQFWENSSGDICKVIFNMYGGRKLFMVEQREEWGAVCDTYWAVDRFGVAGEDLRYFDLVSPCDEPTEEVG